MSFTLLPVEICLMIAAEIFESQEPITSPSRHLHDSAHLHRERRTERLRTFRGLAGTCKAWVDTARTAFWKEVTLFNMSNLVAFARAVEDSSNSKPACIRRVYFRLTKGQPENPSHRNWEKIMSEVQRSVIVVFRNLPLYLDVFHVNCGMSYFASCDVLYRGLQAACRGHKFIEVTKLDIDAPAGIHNVFSHFMFAHKIVHLVLTVTCGVKMFNTPMPAMQLESLVLRATFAGDSESQFMAARDVAHVLRPACMSLQSLTLILYGYDHQFQSTIAESMKHFLSLKSPSTSTLHLCTRPDTGPRMTIGQALADLNTFPPYPTLQYLHLDEFNVTPGIFQQMGCSRLRQLEVTSPSATCGAETVRRILASMELEQLDNLEDLIFNSRDFPFIPFDRRAVPSVDEEPSWKPLERACAARSINCVIRHSEWIPTASSR